MIVLIFKNLRISTKIHAENKKKNEATTRRKKMLPFSSTLEKMHTIMC